MKKHRTHFLTLSLIFPLIFLIGCATLNRSECEVANWEIIGFEDGASGKPASTVGQHRSACAESSIAPELNLYLKGHKGGMTEYCTYQNGFDLGQRGRVFTDICAEVNSKEFNLGYQKGKQHYLGYSEIQRVISYIYTIHSDLKGLTDEIKHNEELIILSETTSIQRRILLKLNKNLNSRVEISEKELFAQESLLFELEDRYAKLAN